MTGRFHPLAVADIRHETPDCVSIAFAVPDRLRRDFDFRPGQYLTLRPNLDGEEVRRCYSICSGLDEWRQTGELRIAVKRVAGGVFSAFVAEHLAVGDTLAVMPPQGRFTILPEPGAARLYLALACGVGITPVISLAKTLLSREKHSHFALLYGNRTSRDIVFAEELARLKDRHLDRLSVTHVLSREAQDLPVLQGRLDPDRIRRLWPALLPRAAAIDRVLLCGPAAMMDWAMAALVELGVPAGRILRELFLPGEGGWPVAWSPDAETAPPEAVADIVIDGRHHEVPVPEGVSIIDAARNVGLDLPYSCRAGMCCTCRARLTDGRAEMAVNYSLQPWEIAAGFILTCQARPLSPRLALDYDAV